MKLAWLIQRYEDCTEIEVHFEDPDRSWYFKVTPIVYAEIQNQ